jgi:glycosyltransferase involved in cell wall biosynthesis
MGPWLGIHQQYRPRPLRLRYPRQEADGVAGLPVISIVTPSFNQGRFLRRTIRSVLDQHYPLLEYVVQDGCSTDETVAILRECGARLSSWMSAPDGGQAQALNRGFGRTTGEIMAYLNSDDILLPGALKWVARFFVRHPDVDVIYGHRLVVNESDAEVGRWVLPPHSDGAFLWNNYIPQETLFWRRRVWKAAGAAFDESLHYALDWDLLLRFRMAGARFARLPRFLGAFRCHASQKSSAHLTDLGLPEMGTVRQRCHGRAVESLEARLRALPFLFKHILYQRLYQWKVVKYGYG